LGTKEEDYRPISPKNLSLLTDSFEEETQNFPEDEFHETSNGDFDENYFGDDADKPLTSGGDADNFSDLGDDDDLFAELSAVEPAKTVLLDKRPLFELLALEGRIKSAIWNLIGYTVNGTQANLRWINDDTISTLCATFERTPDAMLLSGYWAGNRIDPRAKLGSNQITMDSHTFFFIPVCHQSHWTVFTLDRAARTARYYNSLSSQKVGSVDGDIQAFAARIIEAYLMDSGADWTHCIHVCEQQKDEESCDLFVTKNIQTLVLKRHPRLPTSNADPNAMRITYVQFWLGQSQLRSSLTKSLGIFCSMGQERQIFFLIS
jgi:hypothetical protein